jgi:hypothetical protein
MAFQVDLLDAVRQHAEEQPAASASVRLQCTDAVNAAAAPKHVDVMYEGPPWGPIEPTTAQSVDLQKTCVWLRQPHAWELKLEKRAQQSADGRDEVTVRATVLVSLAVADLACCQVTISSKCTLHDACARRMLLPCHFDGSLYVPGRRGGACLMAVCAPRAWTSTPASPRCWPPIA